MKLLSVTALAMIAAFSVNAQTARLQVIHNSPDAAATVVDVYANGALLIPDFAFRTATPFIDVPAAVDISIAVAPGNSTSAADAVYTTNVNFMQNETYVVVAAGTVASAGFNPAQPFGLYPFAPAQEQAVNSANTDVLVFHGATDAPAVNVTAAGGTPVLVSNLPYGSFNPAYLELPTFDYAIDVREAASNTVVASYQAPLAALGLNGNALVVLASGFLDPSLNNNGPAFGLFAALPTGGNLVALPLVTTPAPAQVQVIHNSADAAAAVVDVYANGALLIPDFAFRTATPFVDVPSDVDITLAVAPGNSLSAADAVYTQTVNLAPAGKYVVVANGIVSPSGYQPVQPFNLYVYTPARTEASMAANTDLIVFHGATDAPTVDVTTETGTALVNDVAYGEFASNGYLELPVNDYIVQVRDASGTNVVAQYSAPLAALSLQGQALTVLASGFLNPANNSNGPAFGLFAATINGGNLVELPLFTTINANAKLPPARFYPNPATNVVSLQLDAQGAFTVDITDASGRLILSQQLTDGQQNVDVSGLSNGVYMLSLKSRNALVSTGLVTVAK